MSLALQLRIQPTMGRKERQSALGVFGYCWMIHQCEADRKNAELSAAYQTRRLPRREGGIGLGKHSPGQDLFPTVLMYSAHQGKDRNPGA